MSGSGIGTPSVIVPGIISPTIFSNYPVIGGSCFGLAKYASIIGYSECAFFGISDETNNSGACRSVWTKYQRDTIENYIAEAIENIENAIGYPLCPRWIVGEEHPYKIPILLNYGKIISLGTRTTTAIGSDIPVNYLTDPATVTIPTAITSVSDIHVFYPDTDIEIDYSAIELSGGNLVIHIPKCRLVSYSKLDNPMQGWVSSDPDVYQAAVDIVQYTNDETDQASLIEFPTICDADCEKTITPICAYTDDADVGIVRLGKLSSTYCLICTSPSRVTVNYRAGLPTLTKIAESVIVRLAHSLMPEEPCGCDVTQRLWKRDRNIPTVLSRERLNCPFGLSDGAWAAWRFAMSIAQFRMSEFAS